MAMIRLIDHTPKDSMTSMIKALDERLSRIETGSISIKANNQETNNRYKDRQPVSISGEDFFQEFGSDLKEEKDSKEEEDSRAETDTSNSEGQEVEKSNKPDVEKESLDPVKEGIDSHEDFEEESVEDGKLPETNPFSQDSNVSNDYKEASDNKEEKKSNAINPKSLEHAIRNYALKKFPSSKKLFEQVIEYKVANEVLTYYVNEIGLTYAKVMANLFRGTEEAFYKQTKNKVIIKFELVASKKTKESKAEEKGNIDKVKEFFGEDNIEIID